MIAFGSAFIHTYFDKQALYEYFNVLINLFIPHYIKHKNQKLLNSQQFWYSLKVYCYLILSTNKKNKAKIFEVIRSADSQIRLRPK